MRDLRDERQGAARERAMRLGDERGERADADAAELARNLADPMLCETQYAYDDGRVRTDHFRGLTKGQTKQIYRENERLEEYNADRKAELRAEDALDKAEQDHLVLVVNAYEHDKTEQTRAEMDQLRHDLERQRLEERDRRLESKAASFGHIKNGVLTGFGKSYR